jgi:predicted RNA-binding Zn-ribbon protein involved in translation (DUF1610 family)
LGRLKRPRKAWGHPNFLDPLILIWLHRRSGKGRPYDFPILWINVTTESELPPEFRFTRRAVYYGFRRLERKGLIRRVEGKVLRYELVNPDQVYTDVMEFWMKVDPPKPSSRSKIHERFGKLAEKTAEDYKRLPPQLRRKFEDVIVEDHIFTMPLKGAFGTREMLTLEEAEALKKRVRGLLHKKQFDDREKRWKVVPYMSRPPDWKRPSRKVPHKQSIKISSYRGTSDTSIAEHPLCPECGAETIFDPELGVYVCPKCGLEVIL